MEVDFSKKLLIAATKLPRNINKYEKFHLIVRSEELFIEAVCQIEKAGFVNEFLIHSGYSGDILLDDKFVSETKIGQQITITGEKNYRMHTVTFLPHVKEFYHCLK